MLPRVPENAELNGKSYTNDTLRDSVKASEDIYPLELDLVKELI